jgi:phosphohistidine phosphatase
MKRLFLLRHAKSSWDDSELDDHDRPLAPRGRRAVALIAEHLRRERIAPVLVLCSSARRTRSADRRRARRGDIRAGRA